ncbi:MAG TPA: hypothetical protein PLL30_12365 [Candidatus Krumholzibacteria bacterium]|nr:hypothetical protein [Candidatus Krumholzibacteria bacterium]HPD72562.1 hypothetical protein [Candidatus Krumholzibacteria bacterium]HRY40506.1 hypothetical protein [Candidatus Krumholzibacteria bacterium]
MRRTLPCVVVLLLATPVWLAADGGGTSDPVARNEALALKTAVKSVVEALGTPPAGYDKTSEDYRLPTEMGMDGDSKQFWLASTEAEFEYLKGKSGEQLGQEYQQKIMDAQARGDYTEMQRLSTEFQQTMMAAASAEMAKITVRVWLNHDPYQTIDPEGVIWETPGAIALRKGGADPQTEVLLVFDPKTLADTQKVSRISLHETIRGPAGQKTAVRAIVVELVGPEAAVTEWANNVDKGKVLALIHE